MDDKRRKRYLEKTDLVTKRIKDINDWKDGFFVEEKDKLASYKAFQEIAEASLDIIAMMLKDIEKVPEDDYSNINKAIGEGILPGDYREALNDLNGLRNRIVHEYNGLDDRIALNAIEEILPIIAKFIEVVRRWIQ